MISKMVHLNKAFKSRKWSEEELSDLLHLLEKHVNTTKIICNYNQKELKIIKRFWRFDTTNLLKSK